MLPEEFQKAGYALIDQMAGFLKELPTKPVTTVKSPSSIRAVLGEDFLPEKGTPAAKVLEKAATFLTEHSLLNSHPRIDPSHWSVRSVRI